VTSSSFTDPPDATRKEKGREVASVVSEHSEMRSVLALQVKSDVRPLFRESDTWNDSREKEHGVEQLMIDDPAPLIVVGMVRTVEAAAPPTV
jgi:hypothetical protein